MVWAAARAERQRKIAVSFSEERITGIDSPVRRRAGKSSVVLVIFEECGRA